MFQYFLVAIVQHRSTEPNKKPREAAAVNSSLRSTSALFPDRPKEGIRTLDLLILGFQYPTSYTQCVYIYI